MSPGGACLACLACLVSLAPDERLLACGSVQRLPRGHRLELAGSAEGCACPMCGLASMLRHIDVLEHEIAHLDHEVNQRLGPHQELLDRLDETPAIGRATGEQVLAEITSDMTRFPSEMHLASWAKLCPGKNESAGKRKSGRTGPGNRWLRAIPEEVQ